MTRWRTGARYLLGLLFVAAGLNHFLNTPFYMSIMPPYLPWPRELVYVSGVAEITLGVLLLLRRWMIWAAWGLLALLIAVFPANLHMATHPELYPSFSGLGLWLRLPLQGVLMMWVYGYTRDYSDSCASKAV